MDPAEKPPSQSLDAATQTSCCLDKVGGHTRLQLIKEKTEGEKWGTASTGKPSEFWYKEEQRTRAVGRKVESKENSLGFQSF